MSNQRTANAVLKNCKGPYFLGLDPIQSLYRSNPERLNDNFVSNVRKRLPDAHPEFDRLVTTSDEYLWMFGLRFDCDGRRISVLLPCATDGTMDDGTFADRHVALYFEGEDLDGDVLARIIRRVVEAFEKAYGDMYGHI